MNKYKKITILLSFFILFSAPLLTYAQKGGSTGGGTQQQPQSPGSSVSIPNPLKAQNFDELVTGLIDAFSILITGLGTIMIIIAGILFLISAGDPNRMQTAKSALTFAIIGILIGLIAQAIGDYIKIITRGSSLGEVIYYITLEIGIIIAGLGTIMVIIAGVFYLISFGNPERMEIAKKTLIYAVIGIIIGLTASAIVEFIRGLAT